MIQHRQKQPYPIKDKAVFFRDPIKDKAVFFRDPIKDKAVFFRAAEKGEGILLTVRHRHSGAKRLRPEKTALPKEEQSCRLIPYLCSNISTRLLFARPASVSFVSTGASPPLYMPTR